MKDPEKPRAEDKICCISKLKVQQYFSDFDGTHNCNYSHLQYFGRSYSPD